MYTSGVVRAFPVLAPAVVSSTIGAPSNGPPTLPSWARNSSMIDWLKSGTRAPPGVGHGGRGTPSGSVAVAARLLRRRGRFHSREETVVRVQDHELPG